MKWPVKRWRTIEEKEGESMVMNVGGRHAPGKRCRFSSKSTTHFTNPPHTLQIHCTLYKSAEQFSNPLCSLQFTVPVLYTHFTSPICSLRIDFIHNIREYSVHKYTIDSRDLSYYFVHLYSSLLYYNLWFSVSPIVSHKMLIRWAMKRI